MRNSLLILTSLLLACTALAQGGKAQPPAERPGPFDLLGKKPSGGWEESNEMPYSFAAAKLRMKSRMERRGYSLKHEIDMGKRNESCLMLWEKDGKQTIVMLWRIDVDKTGYSLGEIKEKKK